MLDIALHLNSRVEVTETLLCRKMLRMASSIRAMCFKEIVIKTDACIWIQKRKIGKSALYNEEKKLREYDTDLASCR